MPQVSFTPRRVAPYLVGGTTSLHILVRMHRLSRQPATDMPLHFFLLKNSDVLLSLGGTSVVIWHLATYKPGQDTTVAMADSAAPNTAETSLITRVVHELRQVFTTLLLGLGVINRRAKSGDTQSISGVVQRLNNAVRRGIDTVNGLEGSASTNGLEREYGA